MNKFKTFATRLFSMTLTAVLKILPASVLFIILHFDSQAAIEHIVETCPFTALNALATGASVGIINYDTCYGELSAGISTWTWNTGSGYIVYGAHQCATNSGKYAAKGTPNGSSGQYCWCKLLRIDNADCAGSWIFNRNNASASNCSAYCAFYCANYVQYLSDFRAAVVSPHDARKK